MSRAVAAPGAQRAAAAPGPGPKLPELPEWPEWPERPAAAPCPEAAARTVMHIVKNHYGVCDALTLDVNCSARDILEKLNDHSDPPARLGNLLAKACCDEKSKQKACSLLPIALEVLSVPQNSRKPFQPWLKYAFSCCITATVALLLLVALILSIRSKNGMHEGLCQITDFADAHCNQEECTFHVSIATGEAMRFMEPWTPQTESSYRKGRTVWSGEPFRCCDDGDILSSRGSCCGLRDDSTGAFCDNWPHRFDSDGNRCSAGPWPCLYELHEVEGIWTGQRLQFYTPPPLGWLCGPAAVLASALVALWVEDARRRRSCVARWPGAAPPPPAPLSVSGDAGAPRREGPGPQAPAWAPALSGAGPAPPLAPASPGTRVAAATGPRRAAGGRGGEAPAGAAGGAAAVGASGAGWGAPGARPAAAPGPGPAGAGPWREPGRGPVQGLQTLRAHGGSPLVRPPSATDVPHLREGGSNPGLHTVGSRRSE